MKKPFMSLCAGILLTGSIASGSLLASPLSINRSAFIRVDDEKVKIKSEDLPEAIRTKLSSDEYKGWAISAAYLYKESKSYQVDLKKGVETKTVKFDKDAKVVD